MERMPVRKWGLSSPGVGVIERVDAASSRSAVRVAFLLLPSFQDMIKGEDVSNIVLRGGRMRDRKKNKRETLAVVAG
jgi:hypothetical protein